MFKIKINAGVNKQDSWREWYRLSVNNRLVIHFYDSDSPEDNNLGRNFSGIKSIPDLLQQAYNAGKNGEEFSIEEIEDEEDW